METSKTRSSPGCDNRASSFASASNRASMISSAGAWNSLIATARRNRASVAACTVAIPPRPTCGPSWYRWSSIRLAPMSIQPLDVPTPCHNPVPGSGKNETRAWQIGARPRTIHRLIVTDGRAR